MLAWLKGRASARKLRLFTCACVRRAWESLDDDSARQWVEAAESGTESVAGLIEYEMAGTTLSAVRGPTLGTFYAQPEPGAPPFVTLGSRVTPRTVIGLLEAMQVYSEILAGCSGMIAEVMVANRQVVEYGTVLFRVVPVAVVGRQGNTQGDDASSLRDIIGNPFHSPPAIAPAWLAGSNSVVQQLAQAAYQERALPAGHLDRARLAVLCDALLESGCPQDDELLLHLRGAGPHLHGCWAIDRILDKP
jgi:acetyl-CoA carboxylase biotin carboxyl carrier protein